MKAKIEQAVSEVVSKLKLGKLAFGVEHPADESYGDYSTNVALVAAKLLKKNPREVAVEVVKKLEADKNLTEVVEKIEVAGPGFVNFRLKTEYLLEKMKGSEPYMKLKGKRIMVEYTDPNPFKEFHIGHLYSNIVGETLARLFEAEGAQVWRADFFGDVGMHVAKAIWGLKKKLNDEGVTVKKLGKMSLAKRQQFMGQAYAAGATVYGEDSQAADEIKRLNLVIFVAAQEHWREVKGWQPKVDYRRHVKDLDREELDEVKKLWVMGRQWSLDYFESVYKRLGTKFDGYYPESLTGEWGYDFVLKGLGKGIFERSDGAIVYKGEKHGFHTRVFINKMGLPTYETKDIGNAPMKYSDYKYDKSLIVTGNEINDYFKVVIAAMREVNPSLGSKTEHLGHGMVKLASGKMSSRTGKILQGEWLLDEAKRRVLEIIQKGDSLQGVSLRRRSEVAEQVGMAAVRYALLKSSIGREVTFDADTSVSLEGDSGPYLQYTYARAQSVLRKSKAPNPKLQITNYKPNVEEFGVLRWLYRFAEVVESAAAEYAPNQVCSYLYELAQRFNGFYSRQRIIGSDEQEFRLVLTSSVAKVLKQGLYLLGIEAVERM